MPEKESSERESDAVERPMPEPIPDTLENVAQAILKRPPKKHWRYLNKGAGPRRRK